MVEQNQQSVPASTPTMPPLPNVPSNPIQASMNSNTKAPWSWWSVLVFSLILGFPASYFIVWNNLKRMGKAEEAKKFLMFGGIIVAVVSIGLLYISVPKYVTPNILALPFPIWLHTKYLNQWQKDNPGKAKFSWSLIAWGLLGLIIWTALLYLASIILPK